MTWAFAAVVGIALVAACDTESKGGAGATGGGEPLTASTSGVGGVGDVDPNKPCGRAGGPPCTIGALCAPGGTDCAHGLLGSVCQTLDNDCKPLDRPACSPPTSCGVGAEQYLVCSCDGKLLPSGCANQIANDPSPCSTGDFACGDGTCRNYIEVCALSDASGSAPHCAKASRLLKKGGTEQRSS